MNSPTITSPGDDAGRDDSRHGRLHGAGAGEGQGRRRRADMWAFGVVLFEMLTGTRAFEGDGIADTLGNVMKVEPDWQRLPASTPPRVVQVVRACLQKDPQAAHGQRAGRAPGAATGAFETAAPQATATTAAASRGRLAWMPRSQRLRCSWRPRSPCPPCGICAKRRRLRHPKRGSRLRRRPRRM